MDDEQLAARRAEIERQRRDLVAVKTDLHNAHAEVERLRDLVSSMWLYIGHHAETQLTTEQKELLYDVVDALREREGLSPEPMRRWWRDA